MCAEVGAVEGLVLDWTTGTLYWTCASTAAIRSVDVRAALARRPGAEAATEAPEGAEALGGPGAAGHARTVLRLEAHDRPRGIDFDPCERY